MDVIYVREFAKGVWAVWPAWLGGSTCPAGSYSTFATRLVAIEKAHEMALRLQPAVKELPTTLPQGEPTTAEYVKWLRDFARDHRDANATVPVGERCAFGNEEADVLKAIADRLEDTTMPVAWQHDRRLDLIEKAHTQGLSDEERVELKGLEAKSEAAPKWRSIDEPPPKDTWCWVTDGKVVSMRRIIVGLQVQEERTLPDVVSAWLPIDEPEPPKGKEEVAQ